jgi:hypothetical protein
MAADKVANEAPISVRSFSRNNVIGLLGVSLGTVVRISGIAHVGNKTNMKADEGQWILDIDGVNGRSLNGKVRFNVTPKYAEAIKSIGRFECYGTEYGGFYGDPRNPDNFDVEAPLPTSTSREISYRPSLHICKLKDRRPNPTPQGR